VCDQNMGIFDHLHLTDDGRKLVDQLLSSIVDQRMRRLELRVSNRRKKGALDRSALALVERLEGAWMGRGPKVMQRMRLFATLQVLGEMGGGHPDRQDSTPLRVRGKAPVTGRHAAQRWGEAMERELLVERVMPRPAAEPSAPTRGHSQNGS
jgi:hypothetical protein